MPTIQEIKSSYRIEEVIGRTIHLKRQGSELVGNCPFHSDEHASMKVNPVKQKFKCFPCGAGGDMFDFFTLQGMSVAEIKQAITNGTIVAHTPVVEPAKATFENRICDQTQLPNPYNFTFSDYGNPVGVWAYHNKEGQVISYACRFDLGEGKKDVIPLTYKQKISASGQPQGNPYWAWKEWGKPSPLYSLHELYLRLEADVLLVEGEKAAEAAKVLFPDFVCMTWPQGKDNVKYADWSVLEGRNVFLWPDNDIPGILAMFGGWDYNEKSDKYTRFKGVCEYVAASFKWIRNEPTFPNKWDVADADWSIQEANDYLNSHIYDIPIVSEYPPNHIPEPIPEPPLPVKLETTPIQPPTMSNDNYPDQPFACMGFENNNGQHVFVFYVYRSNTIIKMTPGGMTTNAMIQLASINYWEDSYPGKGKFNMNAVVNHLMGECYKKGMFNPSRIRGRGAWIDNGVPVVHCGDSLIVDGKYTPFNKHKSKYLYEANHELGFKLTKPLTKEQSYEFLKIVERLNWTRDINSRLLAGWIVIAPLCGALKWRPHLWLTGASNTGKSWVMSFLVKTMLGEMVVQAQSETTEAGIRQTLKTDALPVLFDEAEPDGQQGLQRIQANVGLARAASTDNSGDIIKGSAGGSANQYKMRSCFIFSSIGVNLIQRADISRVTVLELFEDISANKKEKWEQTKKTYTELITPEYVAAFQSRSVMMMPTILKNAETFSNAVSMHLDSQRAGDQLGAMLAGAYSLASDNEISLQDAIKWIHERNWEAEKMSENTKDEIQVLEAIMSAEIIVETGGFKYTQTVGEVILIAREDLMSPMQEQLISVQAAKDTLRRSGMRVDGFKVLFAYKSTFLMNCMRKAGIPAFEKNYHTMLSRLEGAEKVEKTTFGSGMAARAVRVDSKVIFGDYENPGIRRQEEVQGVLKIS